MTKIVCDVDMERERISTGFSYTLSRVEDYPAIVAVKGA